VGKILPISYAKFHSTYFGLLWVNPQPLLTRINTNYETYRLGKSHSNGSSTTVMKIFPGSGRFFLVFRIASSITFETVWYMEVPISGSSCTFLGFQSILFDNFGMKWALYSKSDLMAPQGSGGGAVSPRREGLSKGLNRQRRGCCDSRSGGAYQNTNVKISSRLIYIVSARCIKFKGLWARWGGAKRGEEGRSGTKRAKEGRSGTKRAEEGRRGAKRSGAVARFATFTIFTR